MMRAITLVAVLLCAAAARAGGPHVDASALGTYAEMRARVVEHYQEGRYAEAAGLLEEGLERFSDHLLANCYNLALMYGRLGRLDDGLAALNRALDEGLWFGKYSFGPAAWDPYRERPGFAAVLARSESARQEAVKRCKPQRLIVLPEGYDPGRPYPLFVALHGGGENIGAFKDHWISPVMQRDFIVAYLQSSLIVAPDGYDWTEDLEVTRREIRAAYEQLLGEYAIDVERTIIGGFSSGGVASLEAAFGGTIPVAGFIVLCPARPDGVTEELIVAARARDLRGTLLTTERDRRVEDQRALAAMFAAAGLDHRFEVLPDIGHWYPDDLAARIDGAIDHILEGRP